MSTNNKIINKAMQGTAVSSTPNTTYMAAEDRFNKAVKIINKMNSTKATEDELGKIYGLYKQSTVGNCNIKECPNKLLDYKAYKKWQNWKKYEGKSKTDAMNEYADFTIDMVDKYGLK